MQKTQRWAYTYFGPLSVTYGSGDTDAFTYDNLGHMHTYQYNIGAQNYNGTLTWNANGTLGSLKTVNGLTGGNGGTTTVAYNYDDLGRLWKASDGVNISQTFLYDQYGNTNINGAPASWTPTYVSPNNNKYSALGSCGNPGSICYDTDGNLLSDSFYNYTWNAEDKLVTVNGGTPEVYDAFNRVVEDYSGQEFLFVPGIATAFVSMSGQTLNGAYVPLPGGGRVIYTPSGITGYMHPDGNGASRVTSTVAQTLYSQTEYSPFGVAYLKSTSNPLTLFDDSGSDLAGEFSTPNRQLHATQGRWIQPDPAGLAAVDPSNPQTWNRYAYVGNNPVSFVDPLGLLMDPVCATSGDGCGGGGSSDASSDGSVDASTSAALYTISIIVNGYNSLLAAFLSTSYSQFASMGGGNGNDGGVGGGGAGNGKGFKPTLGVRAPGETYSQCLAANSGNYSVYNWLPSSAQNGGTKFALGNDVSNALFGDANEGTAGLVVGAGVAAAPLGTGTAGTFGRRTASIFDLNLSGTTGPAPTILGKTGAAEVIGWVSGAFELKLAADIGATAAEALNCIGHR